MGNQESSNVNYQFTVSNSKSSPDTTEVLRCPTHPDALVDNFVDEQYTSSWDLFIHGLKLGESDRCLGYRRRNAKDGTLDTKYTWKSYSFVRDAALLVGSYLLEYSLMPLISFDDEAYGPAQSLRLLGVFSKNCLEWFVCEQACNAYNFTLVPLYDSLGEDALLHILEQAQLVTVACSLECLPLLLFGAKKTKRIKTLLLFSPQEYKIPKETADSCDEAGITTIVYYHDIMKQKSHIKIREISPGKAENVNTICYTSGTMSKAKGVLLTHRNIIACVAGLVRGPIATHFFLNKNDSAISYLPLAHVLERAVCNLVFYLGASLGIYSGDSTKLLEDVSILNPTVFVSVPRLYNRIYDAIMHGVSEKSVFAQFLFNYGKSTKLAKLRHTAATSNAVWDKIVFKQTKRLMGNSLRYMICGGAPLDTTVQELMKVFFCVPLLVGYGLTETLGPAILSSSRDPVSGHTGGAIPCIEFCLESVPEMSYNVSDVPPRGEVLIRGATVTPGYFRNSQETKQILDDKGWLHTGDIAVLFPTGCIKIIDRKKNIFKLSQGEYVAPDKIETIYLLSHYVSQIFVYGYSDKNFLVAIVVPDQLALEGYAEKEKIKTKSFEELCCLSHIKAFILKEMDKVACEAQLKGFERVRYIYLEPNPFTVENNLLTPTFKVKRNYAKQVYEEKINNMYAESS